MSSLSVNFARLKHDIETLGMIGRESDHGLYRMAFSDNDMLARAWLVERIDEAGLDLHIDGAANIHARLGWTASKASVMTGSHMDTVPAAGHLDGALGVLVGLECLRSLKEQQLDFAYGLESVAFSDEEGRFGDMFGSQAICGQLTPESILQAVALDGTRLLDAMAAHGLDAMDALSARRDPQSIHAFIELHIEQGPILHRQNLHLGVVEAIAGLFKWRVRFIGMANHAGTTPMDMRRDAFQGVAEIASEIPRILEENGSPRGVATIGKVELLPGAANVVPGRAEFTLDVRDTDPRVLENLADAFRRTLSAIARRRDLMFEFEVLGNIPPAKCDAGIVNTIDGVCKQLGINSTRMHSGAAHDTQFMSRITRAGMLFVPSIDGRSHSPAEWTPWEDIELGANVMLNTLSTLAGGNT